MYSKPIRLADTPATTLATFPRYLLRNAAERGGRPAFREKEYGIWQGWTWSEVLAETRALALGLADLGVVRGDRVAILGDNRPRLYWSFAAVQCLGAVPVPVYQDSVADEVAYVVDHAEARVVIAENQEQVDKLLSVRERLPHLAAIVYEDPKGMRHYAQAELHPYAAVQERGRRFDADHPGFFAAAVEAGQESDLAVICYTSGTTGRPKGVMLSHAGMRDAAAAGVAFDRLGEGEEILSYLPMAWVGDHYFSYAQALIAGFCVNCPESGETVLIDLREIGPTYFFAPPRIFENLLTTVSIRMEDAGWINRRLWHHFMALARRVGRPILEGRPVGLWDRLHYRLGEALVYGPLKNTLGLSRVRIAYTAGEAIGPDIFDFFRALGLNLKQLYGQTECSVYLCLQADDDVRSDTVGPPGPGVEVRIAESGEVLYRCPGAFVGYFKNPEATAETRDAEGWIRAGDAGVFTPDGHLRIIDRAKDVGRLNDGTLFAPKYLENKLKFFTPIKEAVAFGHERDMVTAFVNIDYPAVASWAERQGITYTSYSDLAARPEVYGLIRDCIEQVNRDLSRDPGLAGSQIRRFLILHKELDADDGELTRTRKVRRPVVAERYAGLVEALYDGRRTVAVEARVTFEDGRSGTIRAELRLEDARAFQPEGA
jgi:long-chain acyl-CoA synthetase